MKPYNPLEKENLGQSVAVSLIRQKAVPLGEILRFQGAGIYSIYYTGDFDAYSRIGEANADPENLTLPIYIGKAVPTGARKGIVDPEISAKGTPLFSRLEDHRKSIEQVGNLNVEDFWCRFLVVDDIWIPLGESLLIQRYRPIWNSLIDGFGNHDPGSGRHAGKRPSWDTLHPGRSWAEKCAPSKLSEAELLHQIENYWKAWEGVMAEE